MTSFSASKERETGLEYWVYSQTLVKRRFAGLSFLFVPFLYPYIDVDDYK